MEEEDEEEEEERVSAMVKVGDKREVGLKMSFFF